MEKLVLLGRMSKQLVFFVIIADAPFGKFLSRVLGFFLQMC
ncbi:hypothetical protein P3G55_10160 [Leptospira sp. 96542]|nr:hypothetical protein [Leptospira sp. 96542]